MNTALLLYKEPDLLATIQPDIQVSGYFYRVDLQDGQIHHVGKNAVCSCYLAEHCPAVEIVRSYLAAGGERAPEPPPGFYPVIPHQCPICGAPVVFDSSLSSKRRGAGWRCTQGGAGHYWKRMCQHLAQKFKDNPWLFSPVVVRNGEQISAYNGILPGDQVLYPGVLRANL